MSKPITISEFNRRLGRLVEQLDAEDVESLPAPVLAEQIIALFRLLDRLESIRTDLERSART